MTEQTTLEGKRVLICEDEGITVLQLQKALLRSGLVVVGSALRGEEAIELAVREKPDLVLMDITLQGLNGLEATRQIMQQQPTCIVMLTANTDENSMEKAKEYGACGYIPKPVDSSMLVPLLLQALQVFYDHHP